MLLPFQIRALRRPIFIFSMAATTRAPQSVGMCLELGQTVTLPNLFSFVKATFSDRREVTHVMKPRPFSCVGKCKWVGGRPLVAHCAAQLLFSRRLLLWCVPRDSLRRHYPLVSPRFLFFSVSRLTLTTLPHARSVQNSISKLRSTTLFLPSVLIERSPRT